MNKFYFLGIGGISMSSLAIMMKKRGCFVRGSDLVRSRTTNMLEEEGIVVDYALNKEGIKSSDVVVVSSAIKPNDKILSFAKECKKKILSRGQLLGKISEEYENIVAVAGSHGKTTTTAMIYEILKFAGFEPTLHLGGFRLEDGKNFEIGERQIFVTEACEYYDNFLNLHPTISVVTNIEKEHLDYFHTFERQKQSFEKFKQQSKMVVEKNDRFKAKNIRHDKNGNLRFGLYEDNKKILDLHMNICEDINTQNCIYAYRVAKAFNVSDKIIKLSLEHFQGVNTRFEKMNCPFFESVICDYAHHPTEILKAISTAQKIFKKKRLVTVFQPHTYSRTKHLLSEFLKVFEKVDCPLFFKTYSARESPEDGISASQFVDILKNHNKNAKYFDNFDDMKQFLLKLDSKETILLFLGAGDLPTILHKNNFIT